MYRNSRTSLLAAFIAYLGISACYCRPVSEPAGLCHIDYDPSLSTASSECTSTRYYYSTRNDTCFMTETTCTTDFNITYSTLQECEEACYQNSTTNDTTEEPTTEEPATTPPHVISKVCTVPHINNGVGQEIVSCKDNPLSCSIYYWCKKDYKLYPIENRVRKIHCYDGVWDEDHYAYCSKIDMNVVIDGVVSDELLDNVVVSSGSSMTLSCKVDGMDMIQYNTTWSYNNQVIPDSETMVTEDGVRQIVISSIEERHEGSYTCSITGIMNEDKEVKVEVEDTTDPSHPKPEIITFHTKLTGTFLSGLCVCQGSPKPQVVWVVNGQTHRNEYPVNSPDLTYSILGLLANTPKTNVSCECSNEYGMVSQSDQLETTSTKKKRSTTENTLCELEHDTAIVSGQIVRNTKSSDHMKVKDVIVSSGLNLHSQDIIRLAKRSEEPLSLLRRNRQFTLKLKRTSNRDYTVLDVLPSDQEHTAGIIC